jgi:butyryl-CoA dehydrogenase
LKGGIVDFNPCLKHKLIRKTVREFAENEIRPIAAEIDHNARFPEEIMQKMRGLNYFGLQAPREMGGAGLDSISYAIVVEELSRVAAGVGLCITVHNSVAVYPLLQFGTPEQKKRLLPGLISGGAHRGFLPDRGQCGLGCGRGGDPGFEARGRLCDQRGQDLRDQHVPIRIKHVRLFYHLSF